MNLNLYLAWILIFVGVISGMLLGSYFHHEQWLGGYTTLRRRMLRLGHIALFGMAILNLLFFFTVKNVSGGGSLVTVAGWGFFVGGVTMPLCCFIMALKAELRMLFALPVVCLAASSLLTLIEVTR
jgi:hypothetical protein